MATEKEYYEGNNHGEYQYTTLEEIVSNLQVMATDPDSYIKNTPIHLLRYYARQAIKNIGREIANDIKAIEIKIGDDLKMTLPQDYKDYVRVSLINEEGQRIPLKSNTNNNLAIAYLTNDQNKIEFNNDGSVKTKEASKPSPFENKECLKGNNHGLHSGDFTINKRRGKIVFSSSMVNKSIVLEYISDGLDEIDIHEESDITVHKDSEQAILDWIYNAIIENRRNVPMNEKIRAKQVAVRSRHKALVKASKLNLTTIAKIIR